MVSDKRKFIFIDIPKTASTSMRFALNESKHKPKKHHSISNIASHYKFCDKLDEEKIQKYFKFTIVRNPYDRLVSLWLWGMNKDCYIQYKSFNYFVRDAELKKLEHEFMYAPQIDFLLNKDGVLCIDFIGKFENLKYDFEKICRIIGRDGLKLKHYKKNKRKKYQDYYDEETFNIVTKMYKKDLLEFGYGF